MRAEGLSVHYGDAVALDDVSLNAPAGQVTMVVGGDGAGKTTLLKAVVGLVPATGNVERPPNADIGFMPTGAGSWPDLTVQENVRFVGESYGLTGEALDVRATTLLTASALNNVRDRLSGQLSGGMRAKLGFVLAMLHSPQLLVLDEPTTGVDPVSRVELWRLISEAAASGTSVLMSTTYLDEAERASSVLVLDAGKALLSGTPDEIVSACPGSVVATAAPERPRFAWRSGQGFHEWFPDAEHGTPLPLTLEDVCIVASLRSTT